MIEKVTGFILKETPYRESSKIIQVLTKEHGMISIICKGAKNIKSPYRNSSQKYTYGIFHIHYKKGKLSDLIAVDIIDNLNNIKSDLLKISYISYLSDLTYQVIKHSGENLYNLLIPVILKINQNLDCTVLTNILELKYLPYLGISLNLDGCIKCHDTKHIVTLNAYAGGFICQNCYRNEPIISPKAIKLIRSYYYITIESINTINISKDVIYEINNFIEEYYDRYSALYLDSRKFLKKILNHLAS